VFGYGKDQKKEHCRGEGSKSGKSFEGPPAKLETKEDPHCSGGGGKGTKIKLGTRKGKGTRRVGEVVYPIWERSSRGLSRGGEESELPTGIFRLKGGGGGSRLKKGLGEEG